MEASKEPPEPGSAHTDTASPLDRWGGLERRWLGTLALLAVGLLVALSAGLLLVQRQATLDLAQAQSQREVKRLAAELEQSLRLAQALVDQYPGPSDGSAAVGGMADPAVQALSLPFDLRRLPAKTPAATAELAEQWLPGEVQQDQKRDYLPLRWHQPAEKGGQVYEMRLASDAVLLRFASEGLPAAGSMSLFRIEDSGATTILLRYPQVAGEQGMTVFGHVAAAVARQPAGVIQVTAVIDGVERVVGYQRLSGAGQRMMVVYALPVSQVLAVWTGTLPMAVTLTLILAGAIAYGAWRLDRSLQALRRSERQLQTLTKHLPDVVARYDRQGRILYVNPAIEQATGHTAASVVGRTVVWLGAPEPITTQWTACLERVFSTGQTETLYFSHPGPKGLRHWEAQAIREPSVAGELPSVLVVSRDITERQEAQAQRLTAQRLFEAVFMAAPDAMSLSDRATGCLLLVNDAFCELFGHSREALIGQTADAMGVWSSEYGRERLMDDLSRGERVRNVSGSSRRPDGQLVHVRYSAERVLIEGEDRLLLLFRDVSQLELDQRMLARSELRFRLAAEYGQVWEWDLTQAHAPHSDDFFIALGYAAPQTGQLQRALLELIHPEDLPRWQDTLRNYLKGASDYRLELRARDAQNRYRWFEVRGSGQRDADGRVTYMAGTIFEISDRKALEESQRHTLTQLDAVANASSAMFWTTDADQHPEWLNQAWLNFTSRDLASECNAFWLDDLHPDDREQCEVVFNQSCAQHQTYSMEYRMKRHDGVYRWLLEQGRPRYDADGRFSGYVGSCLDVTDLRQAEATASERGAMMEQVFDVLQDMLFVVDAQERFVYFQARSKDKLYAEPEQFLGRTLGDVLPPDTVQLQRQAMAQAREHGLQELDYSLPLPEGLRHFNARLAWLPDNKNCMFLVRDVTDQQATQRERERLNEFVLLLFRLANRFINLPVQETDTAINEALGDMGRFVDVDHAYLFDYDMAAETASNTHEWCSEGVSPEIDNLQNLPFELIPEWIGFHRIDQVMHVPDVALLAPGNLRDLLSAQGIESLMAIPLSHGDRCLGFVGLDSVRRTHNYGEEETTLLRLFAQMLVNIRLRVAAEEKIQELTEGLENKVAERTIQLEASIRQLKTANQELESFTYSASHDLRTPLRGIEGFSALLLQEHAGQLDAQGRQYLERIQKSTLHMAQLINDLLAYARLEQMTERIEPVPLAALVNEASLPFLDSIRERHGQLQQQVPDALLVMADPRGLAMVLRNLIDNALKFTPADRSPLIRIEAHEGPAGVELSVADNGQGFEMCHHDRIFGMFQRLHRQDQIPGTGIGLALVSKAIERMGGTIRADSEPGKGSVFHIHVAAPGSSNTEQALPKVSRLENA